MEDSKRKKTSKSKESKKAHRDHGASTNSERSQKRKGRKEHGASTTSERSEKRKGRKKNGGDGLVGTDADFAALESSTNETAYASSPSSRVSEKNAAHVNYGTGADDADAMAKGSGLFPVAEGGGDIEMAGMVFEAETEYAPNVEADSEVMEAMAQQGDIDEAGGITAFVAETLLIGGDDVGVIRTDEEIEVEEKRKYTKRFVGIVCCLVVVIVAIAVPTTLKLAFAGRREVIVVITEEPTSTPSLMPSLSPSSAPSTVRYTEVIDKLSQDRIVPGLVTAEGKAVLAPLSSREDLTKEGSPQNLAARWISDGDGMMMDLTDPGFEQRYVMALFYYATDGSLWINSNGWLSEDSECFWYGIEGSSNGCNDGCTLSLNSEDYSKVCRLKLGYNNNLFGEIPTEMGMLTEMRYLEIQNDFLYGTLPEQLGAWTKIEAFLVNDNFFTGSFPDSFRDHGFLGTVFTNGNDFNGTLEVIPTLKNLEWLEAEDNRFTGSIPIGVSQLKNLRIFNVNNNSLTGFLSGGWDEHNLLEDFEVEDNYLKGPLHESIGNLKFLKDLRLSRNSFTGPIPTNFYDMEFLEELYLDENDMDGELPQTPEIFYDGLQELSIHDNRFEGRFPVEHFENTLRIKILSLHNNKITGSITDNICDRLSPDRKYSRLTTLTADCAEITCTCCTECWTNGELD